jgi:hypothetical protein
MSKGAYTSDTRRGLLLGLHEAEGAMDRAEFLGKSCTHQRWIGRVASGPNLWTDTDHRDYPRGRCLSTLGAVQYQNILVCHMKMMFHPSWTHLGPILAPSWELDQESAIVLRVHRGEGDNRSVARENRIWQSPASQMQHISSNIACCKAQRLSKHRGAERGSRGR